MSTTLGGYPVEWFLKAPSENFKCGICLDVLKNPHQCKNGHNFCFGCISQALETHRECPTCKTALKIETLSISLSLRNVIDEMLVVKCNQENDEDGCEWTGTLEQSVEHFKSCPSCYISCPLHEVHACMNRKCTGKIKRNSMNKHFCVESSHDNITDTLLIMAETITHQKKEIEFFQKLCLNSEATLSVQNGEKCFGTSVNGSYMGFVEKSTGDTYSGYFRNGELSGFGVFRTDDSVISGEWGEDGLNGHGMQRIKSDFAASRNMTFLDTYIGSYKNCEMHGVGRKISYYCTDVGSFRNDKSHGNVERHHATDGDTFIGTFENGESVSGTCTMTDGSVFVGVMDSDCNYFVKGKYTDKDGNVYEGTFCDDSYQYGVNGTGTITYTDGGVYTGEFKTDVRHGKGTLVTVDGTVEVGEWFEDELVTVYDVESNINSIDSIQITTADSSVVGKKRKNSQK